MVGSVPAVLALLLDDNAYEIVGVLHLLTVIVAFGPQFAYPALARAGASSTIATLHTRLTMPALVLVPILGLGMVGLSDEAIGMGDTWVVLSLIGWVVIAAVSWFLVRPALAGDAHNEPDSRSKLAAGTGVTHLLMIVILVLMVFKPGG